MTWSVRLRLLFTVLAGVLLVGLLGWHLVEPVEPKAPVSLLNMNSVIIKCSVVLGLSLLAGFVAGLVSYPYTLELSPMAVPVGLCWWGFISGDMMHFVLLNKPLMQRQGLYSGLKFEPVFWLLVILAGFVGSSLAYWLTVKKPPHKAVSEFFSRIYKNDYQLEMGLLSEKQKRNSTNWVNCLISVAASVALAQIVLKILVQSYKIADPAIGIISVQPDKAQIMLGSFLTFLAIAYLLKMFLNTSYIWVIIGAAVVIGVSIFVDMQTNTLKVLVDRWPAAYFSSPILAISPVQLMACSATGAAAGYWSAVKYELWKKQEKAEPVKI